MSSWDGGSARGYHEKTEFRLRVHDHDEHQFEPSPILPEKPQQFNPRKHRYFPIAVPVLMVANIVVFILMMYSNSCPDNIEPGKACVGKWLKPLSFQPWSENPILGPRRAELLKWGGLESRRVVKSNQGWRLVSAIFINGGVLQLIVNLLALLVVGLRMEFVFSYSRVFPIYIVSGFGGSVMSALFIQNQVFAGASGAVMGLIGASFADIITNWDVTGRKLLKTVDLVIFGLISVAFGLMPQVGNFANVGGFFTGFLLGFVLLLRPQRGYKDTRHLSQLEAFIVNNEDTDMPPVKKQKTSQRVMQVIALLLLFGLLVAGCVVLFIDHKVNKGCSWCHYLACVPNLKWTCPGAYA
jgi:membrane associated rhomboid family serine protease